MFKSTFKREKKLNIKWASGSGFFFTTFEILLSLRASGESWRKNTTYHFSRWDCVAFLAASSALSIIMQLKHHPLDLKVSRPGLLQSLRGGCFILHGEKNVQKLLIYVDLSASYSSVPHFPCEENNSDLSQKRTTLSYFEYGISIRQDSFSLAVNK